MTIQLKATEQHCPVLVIYYAVQDGSTFKTFDEMLKYDHSNENVPVVPFMMLL